MVKARNLILRISEEDKVRIHDAAKQLHKSLTTFVTDAAINEAKRVERRPPRPPARGVHGGVPSYFKGWCLTAANGGAMGYAGVGKQFASGLGSEQPWDIEWDEWCDEVEKFKKLIDADDDDAVWDWFRGHFPKMAKLIPSRRREQFVAGVKKAHEEGRIEL